VGDLTELYRVSQFYHPMIKSSDFSRVSETINQIQVKLNVTDLSVTVLCLPFIVQFTDYTAYFTYDHKEV
jgi:hypothetical protein